MAELILRRPRRTTNCSPSMGGNRRQSPRDGGRRARRIVKTFGARSRDGLAGVLGGAAIVNGFASFMRSEGLCGRGSGRQKVGALTAQSSRPRVARRMVTAGQVGQGWRRRSRQDCIDERHSVEREHAAHVHERRNEVGKGKPSSAADVPRPWRRIWERR